MSVITATPITASRRHLISDAQNFRERPFRGLLAGPIKKHGGRNSRGWITVRHRGGGEKQQLRIIDWVRERTGVPARVETIEYDPNRSARLARVLYADGQRRYIIAPDGLAVGQTVLSGANAPMSPGNALPLSAIPIGTPIYNLELRPGKGAQMVRSAGQAATIQAKEGDAVDVKLPSGELRRFHARCMATIGQVSHASHRAESLGKAGRRRNLGWRPEVRGTAMNPRSHPHGGGEGRSGIGMKSPKSPWGKRTLGKKTRKKRYSDKWILKDRRVKE